MTINDDDLRAIARDFGVQLREESLPGRSALLT